MADRSFRRPIFVLWSLGELLAESSERKGWAIAAEIARLLALPSAPRLWPELGQWHMLGHDRRDGSVPRLSVVWLLSYRGQFLSVRIEQREQSTAA